MQHRSLPGIIRIGVPRGHVLQGGRFIRNPLAFVLRLIRNLTARKDDPRYPLPTITGDAPSLPQIVVLRLGSLDCARFCLAGLLNSVELLNADSGSGNLAEVIVQPIVNIPAP